MQHEHILSPDEFQGISDLVYRHCGINLHAGKTGLVRARLFRLLRTGGFDTVSEYMRHVMEDASGREFADLIDALCTNRTEFFREGSHFTYLREHFLPELIQRKRETRRLRVWSAGCSSGQEAYTLAITVLDALENEGDWDLRILATDISHRMLQVARTGIYGYEALQAVPPLARQRHFRLVRKDGTVTCEVSEALRRVVAFRYLNLMASWSFGGTFDCIFCRNVMIYFDRPTQERLINRLWERLEPGGLLFTGHSESLTTLSHRFRYVHPAIYQRT